MRWMSAKTLCHYALSEDGVLGGGGWRCYWQAVCWSAWYLVGWATIADRVASFHEQLLFIWKSTAFTRGALDRGTPGLPIALNWWTAALNKTRGSTKRHLAGCRTVSSIHTVHLAGLLEQSRIQARARIFFSHFHFDVGIESPPQKLAAYPRWCRQSVFYLCLF
jgi:hypothetical protein